MRDRSTVLSGHAVVAEVEARTLQRVAARTRDRRQIAEDVLIESVYREERRLANAESSPRIEDDRRFLHSLRHELASADEARVEHLLRTVVARYTREISGFFDPRVYRVATRLLPPALGALLHGGRPGPDLFDVRDRILLEGEVEALQQAARLGTVVLVPTHVSNLDSLVLGYGIFALGLPPFAYGAGLNLFSSAVIGYFMRNLGAFTVDREKTDPLYRQTVKEYATVLVERGQHLLFFPGGTRSRSGSIEQHLKLGFLGTAVRALTHRRARDPASQPIYIVPCTITYPLVLEASSLVGQYLIKEGGPHYIDVRDEFEKPFTWWVFLRRLAELDLSVHVRFARPLDILGNPVDASGRSRAPNGKTIDPTRYLLADDAVVEDEERDAEFTRMLAERVVASFQQSSVALPSSVVAFALFERLRRGFPQLDIFRLLRVLSPESTVRFQDLAADVSQILGRLRTLAEQRKLALDPVVERSDIDQVIERGVATLCTYHRPPVVARKEEHVTVKDATLLFYYRNRLSGLDLLGAPELFPATRHGATP